MAKQKKTLWQKLRPFVLAAPIAGALYFSSVPNYATEYFLNPAKQERVRKLKIDPDYTETWLKKAYEYSDMINLHYLFMMYAIAAGGLSALYSSTKQKSLISYFSKLIPTLAKRATAKDGEEREQAQQNLDNLVLTEREKLLAQAERAENPDIARELVYQFERMPEEEKGALGNAYKAVLHTGLAPAGLLYNALKVRLSKKKEGAILSTIFTEEPKLFNLKLYDKPYWKKLHRLNPSIGYYALEAASETLKNRTNPEKAEDSWRTFLEKAVKEGWEQDFRETGISRNEVFYLPVEGVTFVLKRNRDRKAVETEFEMLKRFQDRDYVITPATMFSHDDYNYLVTIFGGRENLYDSSLPAEDKRRLITEQAVPQLEEILHKSLSFPDLRDALAENPAFFQERVEQAAQQMQLDEHMQNRLTNDFRPVSTQLMKVHNDKTLYQILMRMRKDMNPRNLLIDEMGDEPILRVADFESKEMLPSLREYVVLLEFERCGLPYRERRDLLKESMNNTVDRIQGKEVFGQPFKLDRRERKRTIQHIMNLYEYFSLEKHFENAGYNAQHMQKYGESKELKDNMRYNLDTIKNTVDRLIFTGDRNLEPLSYATRDIYFYVF